MGMNFVAKMMIDNAQFNSGLAQSSQQIKKFQSYGDNANKFLSSFGGSLASTATKFASWAGAGLAAKEGLEKFMRSCQSTSDFLDREVNTWKGLFDQFFESLNSGDVSTFVGQMGEVADAIKAATIAADDFADAKASMAVFDKDFQARRTQLVNEYRRTNDPAKKKRIQEQMSDLEDEYKTQMKYYGKLAGDVADTTIAKINAKFKKKGGANAGLTMMPLDQSDIKTLMQMDLNTADRDRAIAEAKKIEKLFDYRADKYKAKKWNSNDWAKMQQYQNNYIAKYGTSPFAVLGWDQLSDDYREEVRGAMSANSDAKLKYQQFIGANNRLFSSRGTSTGGGRSGGRSGNSAVAYQEGSIGYYEQELSNLRKEINTTTDSVVRAEIQSKIDELQNTIRALQNAAKGITPGSLLGLQQSATDIQNKMNLTSDPAEYTRLQEELKGNQYEQFKLKYGGKFSSSDFGPIGGSLPGAGFNIMKPEELDTRLPDLGSKTNGVREYTSAMGELASTMSSLGSAVDGQGGSWLQYGANVVTALNQAAGGINTVIQANRVLVKSNEASAISGAAASAAAGGPLAWLTIAAAVASVVAALASVPKFATGGIVPGSSFVGDNVLAAVNSGEMILNKGQQANLFRQLNGGGGTGGGRQVEFVLRGTDLVGLMNNATRKGSRL